MSEKEKRIVFKIIITKKYKLQCFVIDSNKKKIPIQLEEKKKEYIPCICFNQNEIKVCQNLKDENTIHFIEDWIKNPDEFKLYTITYNNKEYQLISEVLFGLVIEEFRKKAVKEWIIEKVVIDLQTKHKKKKIALNRIKVSLDAIGFDGITFDIMKFDYTQQGQHLDDILEKKEAYEKNKRMVERAKELDNENKFNGMEIDNQIFADEQDFTKEITSKFSLEERSKMKLFKLNNYCIFIASRYFNTFQDHVNLTFVSKRMRGNMEKFHYNPISLKKKMLQFFPNVETLYCYEPDDTYLEGGRIMKYVELCEVSYCQSVRLKEGKDVDFKYLKFTKKDINFMINGGYTPREMKYSVHYQRNDPNDLKYFVIPEGVNELKENIFESCHYFEELTLPSSLINIPINCLEKCYKLTNITIPLNETRVIYGNKIHNNKPHFDQSICLPSKIKVINGNEVEQLTSDRKSTRLNSSHVF